MTSQSMTRNEIEQMVTRALAAFEQQENALNASDRRERARALGLPLSLAGDTNRPAAQQPSR